MSKMVAKLEELWPPTDIQTIPIKNENRAFAHKIETVINLLKWNSKDLPRNADSNIYMWTIWAIKTLLNLDAIKPYGADGKSNKNMIYREASAEPNGHLCAPMRSLLYTTIWTKT